MAEVSGNASVGATGVVSRALRRWPEWMGYAVTTWSLAYGLLGLWWALGGPGFPFGFENDPDALTVFAGARAETGAPVIAVLGFAGAALAVAMTQVRGLGVLRAALLGFAWTVVNPFVCVGGGILWAATAVAYGRRSRGACEYSGRSATPSGWKSAEAAARWGRWAVCVAVVVPLLYAAVRWAWALGNPLGVSERFLRQGQGTGLWWVGAGLATIAVGGAVLTLGLVQRWGEVFPRWIPFLSGKRVPIPLAVVPASLVSVLVTTAGLMFVRLTLAGALVGSFSFFGEGKLALGGENWAALVPELLWPLWGFALGAATLAYYYRRRGGCGSCGRA